MRSWPVNWADMEELQGKLGKENEVVSNVKVKEAAVDRNRLGFFLSTMEDQLQSKRKQPATAAIGRATEVGESV